MGHFDFKTQTEVIEALVIEYPEKADRIWYLFKYQSIMSVLEDLALETILGDRVSPTLKSAVEYFVGEYRNLPLE